MSNRPFKRRHATCGSPPTLHDARRVARIAAKNPHLLVVPLRRDVIFDKIGMPIPDHDGTLLFTQRIHFEFHDQYKLAYNATHKSIVANGIMNDLISENCSKFYEQIGSPDAGYIELDDEQLYRMIRNALDRVRVRSLSSGKRSTLARCA
jgi:hypothetical protein